MLVFCLCCVMTVNGIENDRVGYWYGISVCVCYSKLVILMTSCLINLIKYCLVLVHLVSVLSSAINKIGILFHGTHDIWLLVIILWSVDLMYELEHSDSEKKYTDSIQFSETNWFFSIRFSTSLPYRHIGYYCLLCCQMSTLLRHHESLSQLHKDVGCDIS